MKAEHGNGQRPMQEQQTEDDRGMNFKIEMVKDLTSSNCPQCAKRKNRTKPKQNQNTNKTKSKNKTKTIKNPNNPTPNTEG